MEEFSAILFYSTSYSIWAYKVLSKQGIESKMIPVPRHLSSDCGYCIRIKNIDTDFVSKLLTDHNIEFDSIQTI